MYCTIDDAVYALMSGDVAALPTETVYGLAASIFKEEAIRKIFSVKGRPLIDPLIVHILDFSRIDRYTILGGKILTRAEKLAKKFWPGPLTMILPKKPCVSDLLTAGKQTVAIRCPAHEIFREILRKTDSPIAAPSANPFGYVSPTKASHVVKTLGDKVKFIVDGGECNVGLESTILDICGDKVRILRPGAITQDDISTCLLEEIEPYKSVVKEHDLDCPGQLSQHYSPKTQLYLIDKTDDVSKLYGKRNAIILLRRPINLPSENTFWLSEDGDLNTIAHTIFDMLQTIDSMNFEQVFCQIPDKTGIGEAINDRLSRAAAKWNINLN